MMSTPTITENNRTMPRRQRAARRRFIIGAGIAAVLILAGIGSLFANGLILIPTGTLPSSLAQVPIYVARQGYDLTALRASDGTVLWRQLSGGWYTAASNGLVFTSSTDDASVFALRASDGSRAWTAASIGDAQAAGNGLVIVGRFDRVDPSQVSALSATDGSQRWVFHVEGTNRPYAAMVGSTVYVYGAGNASTATDNVVPGDVLYALRATDGTLLWKTVVPVAGSSAPVVGDGTVYVADDDGYVNAVSASDGASLWRVRIGSKGMGTNSSLAMGSGAVYASSYDGSVVALSASDGSTLWSQQVTPVGAPSAANGVVYVNTSGGNLLALNATDGTQRWSATVYGDLAPFGNPRPLIIGGGIFEGVSGHCILVCREAYVYGIRASDGATAWRYDVPIQVTPLVVAAGVQG